MIDFNKFPHLLKAAQRNVNSYDFDPFDCNTEEDLAKCFAEYYRLPWDEEDWLDGYEDEYNLLYSYWMYGKEMNDA